MEIGRFMLKAMSFLRRRRSVGPSLAAAWLCAFVVNGALAAVDRADASSPDEAAPLAKVAFAKESGVETITLDLVEAVGHVAQRDGDELIIWFDQPRHFDLGALSEQPVSHVKKIRTPGEGASRWLVIDLMPGSDVQSELVSDHRLVITFEGDQPKPKKVAAEKQRPKKVAATDLQRKAPRGGVQPAPVLKKDVGVQKKKNPVALNDASGKGRAAADVSRVARSEPRALVPMARPKLPTPRAPSAKTASNPPHQTARKTSQPAIQKASLPGQFEVDEMALDRALERTLTREGAVLMPFGMVELEPSLSYVRREFDTPALINIFGFPAFGEANIERNDYIASLALRIGLPFESQLEVDAPFTYVDQSETMAIGFDPISVMDDDTGAFGDVGVGVAKTLLKEGGWWPDVVARVRWDSQTGKSVDNDIALGGGKHELTGSVSLVKSQDPLAFFGSIAYEKTFEEDDLDPGDRIGVTVGTVLAASPDTSLRASLRQNFIGDAEFDGDRLEGTDQMAATLNVGASSVLGRGILLDASAEVGLTEDAPDYAARVSLPIRFDLRRTFSLDGRPSDDEEE